MNITIKSFKKDHPKIYSLILEEQALQGNFNFEKIDIPLSHDQEQGNFNWDMTVDGQSFWESIDDGNFNVFYNKYKLIDHFSII